jgi:ATP-dependent DNA helicase RecG
MIRRSEDLHSENQHVEWKESWHDDYVKWICGFANADGGLLVIGKSDKGHITRIHNAGTLLEQIPNKVLNLLGIMVDVNLHCEAGKDYIEIVVEAYPYPVSYKGRYYYRSGSTRQELKGAALDRFLLKRQGKRWDGVPVPHISPEEFNSNSFDLFRLKSRKSGRMNDAILDDGNNVIIENLHLLENSFIKRAGILLFHQAPEKYIEGAYIKIGFFRTDAELIYQDEVHGCLFDQSDKTLDLLLTKYLRAYIRYEGIARIETYPFPPNALREALLNAIVHKDYSSGIPIQISVYEDKIYFWNDGRLPETWGRGIEKIQTECVLARSLPPEFTYDATGLMVKFEAMNSNGSPKSSPKSSPKTEERILDLIAQNPRISTAEMGEALRVSKRAILKQTRGLQDQGRLRRVGPARGGYWEVLGQKYE